MAGGVPVRGVTYWDGSNFHPLAGVEDRGRKCAVSALVAMSAGRMVGGTYSAAAAHPAVRIARFDGGSGGRFSGQPGWQGLGGPIAALAWHDGPIVVGGDVELAGQPASAFIAIDALPGRPSAGGVEAP